MNNQKERTVLGLSTLDKILIRVVPPVLGGVLGWFIPAIAKWATSLAWVPFQGPLEIITSFHGPWVVIVTAFLGLIAGIWLSDVAMKESLFIHLSDKEVRFTIHESEQIFKRDEVSAVFMDGKHLVLLGMKGQELYREKPEVNKVQVAEAFVRHGYSWQEGDPFANEYKRWVPDSPELTASVNALFMAREKAIAKDEKEDTADLRQELSKLGITVRDKEKRQYWRQHG